MSDAASFSPALDAPRPWSILAIAALVLAIFGCVLFPALAAIPLGIIALRVVKRDHKRGFGLAVVGLIFSFLWVGIWGATFYGLHVRDVRCREFVADALKGNVAAYWEEIPAEVRSQGSLEKFTVGARALFEPLGEFKGFAWGYPRVEKVPAEPGVVVMRLDARFTNATVPLEIFARDNRTVRVALNGKNLEQVLGIPVQQVPPFGNAGQYVPQTLLPSTQPAQR